VEARASAGLAWLQYDQLWVGDPILGGFDGRSSVDPLNRVLLSPLVEGTLRQGAAHRWRLRLNGRTLQRATVLDDDLSPTWTITSDGVPVAEAFRERAFVDEASWRWRPDEGRGVDLRVGMLPFSISGGRFLVESWPGVRVKVDAGKLGGPPLVTDLRAAVRTDGSVQAALQIRRPWSMFEHVGLEVAVVHDVQGVAPILESDPGLLLGAFGAANAEFLSNNAAEVGAWIDETYLADDDGFGIDRFLGDAREYLDLQSRATLAYGTVSLERLVGPVLVDVALIGQIGSGTLGGRLVPGGVAFEPPGSDWPQTAPAVPWTHPVAVRAGAFDVAVTWLGDPIGAFGFVQGASGDPDVVSTTVSESPIGAFLAADQAFVRTRLFPVDAASRGGAWTLPPGVGGHGWLAPGGGLDLSAGPVGMRVQGAVPLATVPTCLGCVPADGQGRRVYGVEGGVLAWADVGDAVRPLAEAGVFRPGGFFLDDTDPARDALSDLPTGWRIYAGLSVHWERE
jgi:hypothetical protein